MRRLFDRLEQQFVVKHAELAGGTVWVAQDSVELERLANLVDDLDAAADGDDEETSLYEHLAAAGRVTTLLYLEWSLDAPVAWDYRLSLLSDGEAGAYVLAVPDAGTDDPTLVVTRLHPDANPQLVQAFLSELIAANGAPFVEQLVGSLPNQITIRRPDLVTEDAIAEGLRRYANTDASVWSDMATTAGRLERQEFLSTQRTDASGGEERRVPEADREAVLERYVLAVVESEA